MPSPWCQKRLAGDFLLAKLGTHTLQSHSRNEITAIDRVTVPPDGWARSRKSLCDISRISCRPQDTQVHIRFHEPPLELLVLSQSTPPQEQIPINSDSALLTAALIIVTKRAGVNRLS